MSIYTRAELRREYCRLRVKRMTREELENKAFTLVDRQVAHLEAKTLEMLINQEKAMK